MTIMTNILKVILGVFLALSIMIASGFAAALYFMNRTSAPPAKPIYANDRPALKATVSKSSQAAQAQAKPTATPSPSPKKTETPKPLPPGAYRARVTWSQGLVLRSEPKQDAERIGGLGYNARVIVLRESDDRDWQKVRLEEGAQEGWIKAGNTQKVDESE